MKRSLVVLASLAVLASTAAAKPRKLSTAYALSGVGTGVSTALIVTSFVTPSDSYSVNRPLLYTGIATSVITPSLGNFYANHWLTVGTGVRLLGGALGAYAIAHYQQDHRCDTQAVGTCKEVSNTGISLLAVGGLIFIGGAAYDFKSIRDDVEDYNSHHQFNWSVTPPPSGTGSGAMLGVGGVW